MRLAAAVLAFHAFLALPAAAQAPIVVDASGGGDFTTLTGAIGAAASGDLIVVRTGLYAEGLVVDGKSLTIAAEGGAGVLVLTPSAQQIAIRNLAANESVTLHGIGMSPVNGIKVENCDGPVLFQDCIIELLGGTLVEALFVENCEAVSAVRTTIDLAGHVVTSAFNFGGRALRVADSNVFLHDCVLTGSDGAPGVLFGQTPIDGLEGNAALHVLGGRVVARGSTLTGGTGGVGFSNATMCSNGGVGGPGALIESSSGGTPAELVRIATRLVGGAGGATAGVRCVGGANGPATNVLPGNSIVIAPFADRSFEADCVVADGGTLTGTFRGPPMDFVALAYSVFTGDPEWAPNIAGAFYLGFPLQTLNIGFLNASGVKIVTYFNEDPGLPWIPLWIQPLHFGPEQQVVVSNPRLVLFLDEP